MESTFDATSERECSVCFFDLHLSAAGCHHCSPEKYACLHHAKQMCSCSWSAKFFLFRYDINELNLLFDALEGKLSAVYRWARVDLGLALSSYLNKENQVAGRIGKPSCEVEGSVPKERRLGPAIAPVKKQEDEGNTKLLTEASGSTFSLHKDKPLALGDIASSTPDNCSHAIEGEKNGLQKKIVQSVQLVPGYKTPVCQIPNERRPCSKKLVTEKSEVKGSPYPGNDVILLSDDEGEEMSTPVTARDTVNMVNGAKPIPTTSLNNSIVTRMKTDCSSSLECIKVDKDTICNGPNQETHSCLGGASLYSDLDKHAQDSQVKKEPADCNISDADTNLQQPQPCDAKANVKDSLTREREATQTLSCKNSHAPQNNLDIHFRQKGPRIAKVVRRINCNVEPLDYGFVQSGKLWCDNRAIYPKGFRSRVRYIDVLDPTNMCLYVSEILDAGRDGPLFMVSLERCPTEVFVHLSAARCWDMVREKVNQEITKQHRLGKLKLPPLQPPGSLDGLEMFGFSSPAIVQVIQAMDQSRVCTEYWKSRPLMQIPPSSSVDSLKLNIKSEISNDHEVGNCDTILSGLFKKANSEELHTLYSLLKTNNLTADRALMTRLNEEIHKRGR